MVTIQLKTTNNMISELMILKDKLFRSDLINFILSAYINNIGKAGNFKHFHHIGASVNDLHTALLIH